MKGNTKNATLSVRQNLQALIINIRKNIICKVIALEKRENASRRHQLLCILTRLSHNRNIILFFYQNNLILVQLKSEQLSGQLLAFGNQMFSVRVRLLAICRGELSPVISHKASKSGREGLKNQPPPSTAVQSMASVPQKKV